LNYRKVMGNSPQIRCHKNSSFPGFLLTCCIMVLFFSCGIEEEIYLESVANPYSEGVTRGSLTLPDNSSSIYFQYYMIYYRIYLSDQLRTTINSSEYQELQGINPTLASHYNTINNSYIANENTSTSGLISTFKNLRYYRLHVTSDGNDSITMINLLGSQMYGNQGVEIRFNFLPNVNPSIEISDYRFYLIRDSDASSSFTPILQDRLFVLSDDMIIEPTDVINADVQPKYGSTPLYAYVSLYICAVGLTNNFTEVYSKPTHIGIFQLPG